MRAFYYEGDSYVSPVDEQERAILKRLAMDIAHLVADHARNDHDFHDDDEEFWSKPRKETPHAHGMSADAHDVSAAAENDGGSQDYDAIAHLDFSLAEGGDEIDPDPALARIFPPMSSDYRVSTELRSLTLDALREQKVGNLELLASRIAAETEHVVVPEAQVDRFLAALTDMRLVLAARLEITDDEDAEKVHELALDAGQHHRTPPDIDEEEEMRLILASLYVGLSWWQESLLTAMASRARSIYP